MRQSAVSRVTLLVTIFALGGIVMSGLPPLAHAETYKLTAFPLYSQEGSSPITLLFTVSGITPSAIAIQYEFIFLVQLPSNFVCQSVPKQYNTRPFETEFSLIIYFPSTDFQDSNCTATSLVGTYHVGVNQTKPINRNNVQSTVFFVGLIDRGLSPFYQRTESVSIVAAGYQPDEPVSVTIRTTVSLVVVFSLSTTATSTGRVTASWQIPKDATTTESYLVNVAGTLTAKSPADAHGFYVQPAFMTISAITSSKSIYQRTEQLKFSFQPSYPSGEIASSGLALVTLTRPDRANITLTASYDSSSQSFVAVYTTSAVNQTGTWTASLASYGYDDGFGNTGPDTTLVTSPQLQPATFSISITTQNYFAINEQIRFNATIQYPDGTSLPQSGQVYSFLSYNGNGAYNFSIPTVFDNSLGLWVGAYQPSGAPGGLWSLRVSASDSATPANTGSSTRTVQLANRPPTASFTQSTATASTNLPITFNATSSSDPEGALVAYSWDFGDGATGSGVVVTHTYLSSGSFTVRLTITDGGGSTASSTSNVVITAAPSSPNADQPLSLYWFGILAALIAAMLAGGFMYFRRHRVTHAKLKIDLEAVKTEAGRIENQEFFQSVKDQLRKDKDD